MWLRWVKGKETKLLRKQVHHLVMVIPELSFFQERSTFVMSPGSKGTAAVAVGQPVLTPCPGTPFKLHHKRAVHCPSWPTRCSPRCRGCPPCPAAVYRLSRGDPGRSDGRGIGCLAAGGHQREGVVQQRVHGLPSLLDGRLRGHVLRHRV